MLEEIASSTLSTAGSLSSYTLASTTVLTDGEMSAEIGLLMEEADSAFQDDQPARESRALSRAIIAATGTAPRHVAALKWQSQGGLSDPMVYPGLLSSDASVLLRPELQGDPKVPSAGWIHIPIPHALAQRLLRLKRLGSDSSRVFPELARPASTVAESQGNRPTDIALQHTTLSRLMRLEPLGISLAQWVAGDDLGIDRVPLFYDRTTNDRLALHVAQVTFPWFGLPRPKRTPSGIPSTPIGSKRVPDLAAIVALTASLRRPIDGEAPEELPQRLARRMRNAVHGLAIMVGHRPNDTFERLRIWSFGLDDRIGVVADKVAALDWMVRPVALAEIWIREFRALIVELQEAASAYKGTKLGNAAAAALDGSGPVFLAIDSATEVRVFGRDDYLAGIPPALAELGNFARQYLNSRLVHLVVEPLRVAQMGWHGTREGAWADGSPWSVLSAARELSRPLEQILKDTGWRPLGTAASSSVDAPPCPFDWADAERQHAAAFREQLSQARRRMAERHEVVAKGLMPVLQRALADAIPELRLEEGQIRRVDPADEPIGFSAADQDLILRSLSRGDPRSLEARVARNLLCDLIGDARKRKVVAGPIPRRVVWRWPTRAGAFLGAAPLALAHARAIDETIAAGGEEIPEALRAMVALLLHGGYADLRTVRSAMHRESRLARLRSQPGILLVEPPQSMGGVEVERAEGWARGCLAFHGLAALHLQRWHATTDMHVPDDAGLERLLRKFAPWLSGDSGLTGGASCLESLLAMARACNSLRMDGWARPIGVGKVQLSCVAASRVVSARDNLPVGSRRSIAIQGARIPDFEGDRSSRVQRPRSLLDRLYEELTNAANELDADRGRDKELRQRLIAVIRKWLLPVEAPRPEDLVARFALSLLERGGMRQAVLGIHTIRGYVYEIGRPLEEFMPDEPMLADAGDWTAAYASVIADAEHSVRSDRLDALRRFHWALSREFDLPEVSFADAEALVPDHVRNADAGLLTACEVAALFSALDGRTADVQRMRADATSIYSVQAQSMAAHVSLESAARPGEVARLQYSDVLLAGGGGLRIHKTSQQRIKTPNSRRRARLLPHASSDARTRLRTWHAAARARGGSSYSRADAVFLAPGSSEKRMADADVFAAVGNLVRWATGDPIGHAYWLRKTAVRLRLEAHMTSSPRSLWEMRDLIAEIGHGSIDVTLGSYTHDPVTPFQRWLTHGLSHLSAARLAIAAGRSLSVVARRHNGAQLSQSSRDVGARVTALLRAPFPEAPPIGIGLIEFPGTAAHSESSWPLAELAGILGLIANGEGLEAALTMFHWPPSLAPALRRTLDLLRRDFGVSIGPTDNTDSDYLQIEAPRQLRSDGGLASLANVPDASTTLEDMCAAWLRVVQVAGPVPGVPGMASDWERWEAAQPELATWRWKEQPMGRARLRCPVAAEKQRVGPWPLLRWYMLDAWIRKRILADTPSKDAGV
jgi:hypothetical protein